MRRYGRRYDPERRREMVARAEAWIALEMLRSGLSREWVLECVKRGEFLDSFGWCRKVLQE